MEVLEKSRSNHSGLSIALEATPDMPAEDTQLSITDVVDLLEQQNAIITGGKTREGYPIITLPDLSNFSTMSDLDYQKLMMYLTSVPSMHEADLGFALVIDRRNDKWSSVKSTLLKISSFFPGLIHIAYVIRPAGFFQKAISEVSTKFFREEFKFKVVVCSCVEDLHQFIEKSELIKEMDGTMPYSHKQWIKQRIGLEEFSRQTQTVSGSLNKFTWRLREGICEAEAYETEMVQAMLKSETNDYLALKEQILSAARTGEQLLSDIRHRMEPSAIVNITAVERLLVQLEETERTFDEFWEEHSAKLRQCLDVQRFYIDYKKIQANLEQHSKVVSQMTEIGETVKRVEYLILEFNTIEKLCVEDIEHSEEIVNFGRSLISGRHYWPLECVGVRCDELDRTCATLRDRLAQRSEILHKSLQLQISVDKANKWCTRGIELLEARQIDNCACALDAAEVSLSKLVEFMEGSEQFHSVLVEFATPETKALVSQVLQRIEDVKTMCNKRMVTLRRLVEKPPRPVQPVIPEPAIPLQPVIKPANINLNNKAETKNCEIKDSTLEKDQEVKRGHILSELLETERIYVNELGSIIQGYKVPLLSKEAAEFAPELDGKVEVMFGNFEEIYTFHNDIFLQDLENCISTTELVALCFTHRRDALHKLYSTYCQNIARSERFRESIGDHVFLKACQTKLGHKLPLAAYLLKPVQRITKYQLLLKELLSYSEGKKWCNELQEALECMLVVLKCVNDSMHQLAVTNFWGDLGDLGDLLMQGGFSVWTENKKDRWGELRLKPMQSHLFLYQKALMFCKKTDSHNKETYLFKKLIMMSDVGLTETVKGDGRTFEIWLTGRSEVHRIKAANQEQKAAWVEQIKTLLLQQLTQLKLKQHTTSKQNRSMSLDHYHVRDSVRGLSCDDVKPKAAPSDDDIASYSDCSNPDDEETFPNQVNQDQTIIIPYSQGSRYRVLADYNAVGHSELSVHEGDLVTLLKVGLAGWWYVRLYGVSEGSRREGWVPAAYLEHCARKSSRSCQSVCSDTSSH
ncbi:guanine nucleotide exchange factor DBS-like isoform X3 [Cimex lectularius]|uniref:Guanine nucleotide exchange factor DBS n=1 Tax=Cimex lectularius TaxID=79782 RepID=A0A8I6TDK1_CIMLE|nr:guanine nucleotide exchange factor DBS-like isoform X3 [Cimex lectularius]